MTAWPDGHGLKVFEELDSTNEEARRLALAGEHGPLWITAARQTAGRGRRGRSWETATGNLAATLLLRPARPVAEWAQLSFVAAVAAADMAARLTDRNGGKGAHIAVKWPNDILADGRKLAGILLETVNDGLAIGIGVNLQTHPTDTEFPATSLAALGMAVPTSREALSLLAEGFAGWYDIWCADGFSPIRDAWLARAAGIGARIRARLPGRQQTGIFEGIDTNGALLLHDNGKTHIIAAGEVFFG